MKLVLIFSLALSTVMLPTIADAKVCHGDPVAISYKRLMGGSQHGTFSFSLPNGCTITCKAGDTKRGLNRVCHWN
jgi:hypothetical protein